MTDDEIAKLQRHVKWCPLGWHQGRLNLHRATTDADVISWIQELERLVGLQQESAATKTRLPRPYAWQDAQRDEPATCGSGQVITARPQLVKLPPSDNRWGCLLEVFAAGRDPDTDKPSRHGVWLHCLKAGDYRWWCSCGAESRHHDLDAALLTEARAHFDQAWKPAPVPLSGPMILWTDRARGLPPPSAAEHGALTRGRG